LTAPEEFDPFEVQAEEALRFSISEAEQGRLDSLVMALRSPRPMPDRLRRWLADLFDPEADSAFKVTIQRRSRGKPPKVGYGVAAAAYHVASNVNADSKLEHLIAVAIEKYSVPGRRRISRSSIYDYLSSRWPDLAARLKEAKQSKSSA
jgi:hypothetical protein